jgi:hypothetical protein
MLVYTLLLTCVGEVPETNPYIPKYAKWLAYLIHYGGLEHFDTVVIIIDDVTKEYLDKDYKLDKIIAGLPFNFYYYRVPQPFSRIEGICEKYTCSPSIFSSFTTNLFIDLDYFVVSSLKPLYSSLETKNVLLVQRQRHGKNEELESGIFAFVVSPEIMRFFELVVSESLILYDEDVFNRCIYKMIQNKYEICFGVQPMIDHGVFRRQEQEQADAEAE